MYEEDLINEIKSFIEKHLNEEINSEKISHKFAIRKNTQAVSIKNYR